MQLNPHPSSLPLWVLGATWGGNYALLVRRFCRTQCNTFGAYAFSYILLKPKNLKFNRNWGPEDPLNCYSWVMCNLYSLYIDVRKLEGNSELRTGARCTEEAGQCPVIGVVQPPIWDFHSLPLLCARWCSKLYFPCISNLPKAIRKQISSVGENSDKLLCNHQYGIFLSLILASWMIVGVINFDMNYATHILALSEQYLCII